MHSMNKVDGFLGSFLSKGLKTTQLEVNTDEKTLRPIARLKEPRDLFALPKDKDHDCPQQAPRWPIECQVIEDRIVHIPYVPIIPEPYNQPTGNELKPRPVGEENGIVVFNYNPISAVNYDKSKKNKKGGESSDSDISSSESRGSTPENSTPDRRKLQLKNSFAKLLENLEQRSSSNSMDEFDEDDYDDDDDDEDDEDFHDAKTNIIDSPSQVRLKGGADAPDLTEDIVEETKTLDDEIEDIWASKSPEYPPSTPTFIKQQFGKEQPPCPVVAPVVEHKKFMPKAISPVRFTAAQLARLNVDIRTLNKDLSISSSSSDDDSTEATEGEVDGDDDGSRTVRPDGENTTVNTTASSSCRSMSAKIQNSKLTQATTMAIPPAPAYNLITNSKRLNSSCPQESQNQALTNNLNSPCGGSSSLNACSTTTTSCCASRITVHNKQPQLPPPKRDNDLFSYSVSEPLLPQFSRSAVGGSKFLSNCHPYNPEEYDGLEFESRFESGNLAKAVKITQTYYELYLRPDLYTSRSKQWFYFRVRKTRKNVIYRFSIVNLVKSDSLYNDGMRPLMYSTMKATQIKEGWRRCGENIAYYRNDDDGNSNEDDEENSSYTLTFNVEFPHDNDTVYFAHSYPYTYSELQDYLMEIQKHPLKSKFCKLRLLCRSLAGNNVYYLTVTAPTTDEEAMKRKKSVVVSARVHPSETPSSWMMKGLLDFITSESSVAKRLRHKFIFKLIPMLNPDGVIVGNTRNSLTGKDLNRQYRTVIRETYPSIWYTKAMIKRLIDEHSVSMYCDMHAHSRKHNIFIYGCENKRNPDKKLTEQVFPLMMHKNVADKFSFESCKFKIQRSKEGTGRIVVWMLGITNSYTIEASFGGSSLGSRKGTHFNTADYEHMGRVFCETLLDYCDENPNKVKKHVKCLKQIKKIRKREKREKKTLKLKKLAEQERLRLKIIERLLKEGSSAEEPLNIPLSDYSSDEGRSSSSSDNEGKASVSFSDLEGPCCVPLKAPPCSPQQTKLELKKFRLKRMRKVMHELDRIYFQPLFKKRFSSILQSKRNKKAKITKKNRTKMEGERLKGGEDEGDAARVGDDVSEGGSTVISGKFIGDHAGVTTPSNAKKPLEKTCKKCNRRIKKKNHSNAGPGTEPIINGETAFNITEGGESVSAGVVRVRRRIRVSRKLRLWLQETRKIFIYRNKKKGKHRKKIRSKSQAQRRKIVEAQQRTPIDLPTTDPGSNVDFSTDDDEFAFNAAQIQIDGQDCTFGTIPRTRRILLQSELQRRYIEEIGDGSEVLKCMPPELIVTSPSKQHHKKSSKPIILSYKPARNANTTVLRQYAGVSPPPKTAPTGTKGLLGEFPAIDQGAARRTSSWHNLHNAKSIPKMRIQNTYQFNAGMCDGSNTEELKFQLSLKKKIWTGVQPENGSSNYVERNRPLSWGAPPLNGAGLLTSKVEPKSAKRDENVALFAACTQKLLAWQQNDVVHCKQRNKLPINLMVPEINTEERALNLLKQVGRKASERALKADNSEVKIRKKKTLVARVSDTTQLLARLKTTKSRTLTTSSSAIRLQRKTATPLNQSLGASQRNLNDLANCTANALSTNGVNRFKTGGLVATVSTHPKSKNRKLRALTPCGSKMKSAMGDQTNSTTTLVVTNSKTTPLGLHSAVESSTFVRKVKTKLKKKKSPTSNNSTATRKAN